MHCNVQHEDIHCCYAPGLEINTGTVPGQDDQEKYHVSDTDFVLYHVSVHES